MYTYRIYLDGGNLVIGTYESNVLKGEAKHLPRGLVAIAGNTNTNITLNRIVNNLPTLANIEHPDLRDSNGNVWGATRTAVIAAINSFIQSTGGGNVISVNGQTGTVSLGLQNLVNVTTITPTQGDVLSYNSSGNWVLNSGLQYLLSKVKSATATQTSLEVDSDYKINIDATQGKTTIVHAGSSVATFGAQGALLPGVTVGTTGTTYDLPAARGTTSGQVPVFDATNNTTSFAAVKVADLSGSTDDLSEGSTNLFFTSAEQSKLAGIQSGAEVNVNADWNSSSGDSQILNKPTLSTVATSGSYNDLSNLPTVVSSVSGTAPIVSSGGTTPAISITAATTSADGYMSSADKTKLDGIAVGAEVNVQANWAETNTSSDSFILNKPTIPAAYTDSNVDTHLNTATATTGQILSWTGSDYDWVLDAAGAPAGTVGQLQYNNSGIFGASSNLFWDISNNRLGIGTTTPSEKLHVVGKINLNDGSNNVLISTGNSTITATNTTAVGYQALTALTTGASNTAIGYQAGLALTTGASNILIGYQAGSTLTTESNKLYIENSNSATPLIYGEFDTDLVRINGSFQVTSTTTSAGLYASNQTELRLYELTANGTNYIALKAAGTLAGDTTYTLPTTDGSAGQALTTDASGNMSWAYPKSPVKSEAGTAYTLVLADAGKYIRMTATAAVTITIPENIFAVGDEFFFEQNNTGQVTVAAGTGVTLRNTAAFLAKTAERYAIVGLKCVASNEFILTGERELV